MRKVLVALSVMGFLVAQIVQVHAQEGGDSLFEDDFSDPSTGWEVGDYETGDVGYGDGYYYVTSEGSGNLMRGLAGQNFADVMIDVQATQISAPSNDNNGYGVMCRIQDDGKTGYLLRISGDGFASIYLATEEEFVELAARTATDAINLGNATNHIQALCEGSRLALMVNDVLVAEAEDDTLTEGDIALAATSFEDTMTEIHFDNLVVSSASDNTTTTVDGTTTANNVPNPGLWSSGDVTSIETAGTVSITFTVQEDRPIAEIALDIASACGMSGTITVSGPFPLENEVISFRNRNSSLNLTLDLQGEFLSSTEMAGTFLIAQGNCEGIFEWTAHPEGVSSSESTSSGGAEVGVVPQIDIPQVTVPEITVPEISIPEINIPDISVPQINIPQVHIPQINVPQVSTNSGSTGASGSGTTPTDHGPATGTYLQNTLRRNGLGELTIENGQAQDAVVLLMPSEHDGKTSVYVRAGDSFTVTGIPDDNYEVYFMTGTGWDADQQTFTQNANAARFEDLLPFETSATTYTIFTVTLQPVENGNAATEPLDPDQFPD